MSTTTAKIPAAYFSVADVMERLQLSRATVARALAAGEFPGAFLVGQRWRIPEDDLAAWIKQRQPFRRP